MEKKEAKAPSPANSKENGENNLAQTREEERAESWPETRLRRLKLNKIRRNSVFRDERKNYD